MPALFQRDQRNPLLRPSDLSAFYPGMEIACLLNPGVCQMNNQVVLLVRVAEAPKKRAGQVAALFYTSDGVQERWFDLNDSALQATDPRVIRYQGKDYLTTLSYLRLLVSDDGIHFRQEHQFPPITGFWPSASYGVEDARIAWLQERFQITCTAVSADGVAVTRFETPDFRSYKTPSIIFPPHNKDVALFERMVNGKYLALHRPSSPSLGGHYIWIAESPDLVHWGNHQCLLQTREGSWDAERVGAGASPIETQDGWLVIYHGADKHHRYCLGAALLDKDNPSQVLARSLEPIMEPEAEYERVGFFGDVVFTNGHYIEPDGDTLVMYYGAADSVICRATASIQSILNHLR